ncbi:hypothetical protein DAEQUDRAFT_373451 [Daedalea quercina L-15889]|uniref:Uncharacterized protein n=1 Tax=Daedalea quercina L-15889 TaxID=1314783 RepID=A0A165P6K7_9APHY|nr:hypothetical protein DAEQUDRAFT_373451 [Daedalea quercina L-15889]
MEPTSIKIFLLPSSTCQSLISRRGAEFNCKTARTTEAPTIDRGCPVMSGDPDRGGGRGYMRQSTYAKRVQPASLVPASHFSLFEQTAQLHFSACLPSSGCFFTKTIRSPSAIENQCGTSSARPRFTCIAGPRGVFYRHTNRHPTHACAGIGR